MRDASAEEGVPPDAAGHTDHDQAVGLNAHRAVQHGVAATPPGSPEAKAEAATDRRLSAQPPGPLPRPPALGTTPGPVQARESIVIPELPARPAPERFSQTSTGNTITVEILSRSWTEAKEMLLKTGLWSEPPEECSDPEFIVGKRVWIDGQVCILRLPHHHLQLLRATCRAGAARVALTDLCSCAFFVVCAVTYHLRNGILRGPAWYAS